MTYIPPPPEIPGKVCAVCAAVLDMHYDYENGVRVLGSQRYAHPGELHEPRDHPAVPVDADQVHVDSRCDFCMTQNPTWIVPARSFTYDLLPDEQATNAGRGMGSLGDWAACDTCAEFIRKNQWGSLRRHVMRRYVEIDDLDEIVAAAVGDRLAATWRKLRKHISGTPYRVGATQ